MTMTRQITRLARRIADIVAECNYAQRRVTILRLAPDAYLTTGDTAPDDYAEFLFRTSGTLLREPDARHRAHGQFVG
jgi:hypothetical protein